ncbi:unnamed protein product, partial [Closterium sp. NIES-54]
MPVVVLQGPVHRPPPLFPSPYVATREGGGRWGGARRPFFRLLWRPRRPRIPVLPLPLRSPPQATGGATWRGGGGRASEQPPL